MYYTYILLGKIKQDNQEQARFYVGSTSDLKKRVEEHQDGKVKTTKSFANLKLVYYEACLNKTDARKRELQLKTGFGRGYINRRLESFLKSRA